MTRYDDETVITLLKESVPAVPDLPGRADSVRRLATRQRHAVATRTLGCVAAVVMLTGGTVVLSDRLGLRDQDVIANAAAAMAGESSARISMTTNISTTEGPSESPRTTTITSTMDGAFDLHQAVGSARTVQTVSYGILPEADGEAVTHQIAVGGYTYSRTDGEATWHRSRIEEPGSADEGSRPDEIVPKILEGVTKAKRVGTERIRGVRTVKFTLTRKPGSLDGQTPDHELLWLDGSGRFRKYEMTATATSEEHGRTSTGHILMSFELYDYGVQVDVQPPPASQVVDEDARKPAVEAYNRDQKRWADEMNRCFEQPGKPDFKTCEKTVRPPLPAPR